MALGELTRQLAQQAIGQQMKEVVDALRPSDLAKISETLVADKTVSAVPGENLGAIILGQVQAMQKALKEDEELVVLCGAGPDVVRVLEFFVPSWRIVVLIGIDTQKTITRVITPVESLQLVCKVMKVQAPARPTRLRFVSPKA